MKGKTISHYEILEELGHGAMGTVYKARDSRLDRLLAIKFISREVASDTEKKLRFVREARAASALDHSNICTVFELGETKEGDLFIAMAYCPGKNLRTRMNEGPLPVAEAVHIATQIAEGLARAHQVGIVHRDIKPANIMLTADGGVKIVDFGLAKLPNDMEITHAGGFLGTAAYSSPEQLRGESLDMRTDVWSWGVVTYEMLAGQKPFATMADIVTKSPTPLTHLRTDVPVELDRVVLRALQKKRSDRWRNAEEIVASLKAHSAPPLASNGNHGASLAVLPFVNLSPEPDSEYFSDGLTEELIHALSQLQNLRVVSRTSAFEFKGKTQDIRSIGDQLNVASIVEGSVRRHGEKLRVSAQLVNVSDGYCLWSQRFDRELKDVFAVQDEIAQTIADTLKIRLETDPQSALVRPRTENIRAYDLYLRGRFQWNKRSPEGFQRALEYFQAALAEDPNFGPAHSGIADYHIGVSMWGLETPAEAWPKAKEGATKALIADETLAEAHASMGTIRMWNEWRWREAEREFLRAIELNPGHPNAHVQYNILLVQTGRFDEAEREIRTAMEADPLSIPMNSYLAGVYHYRRDYDRSLQICRQALELSPDDIELHVVVGLNYEQKKMYAEAIQEIELALKLAENNPLIWGPLGSCCAAAGDRDRALELLAQIEELSKSAYVAYITPAMICLALKDYDRAFDWLEKAAEAREVLLCYLAVGPIYDGIRNHPRYLPLLNRIGLAPHTEATSMTE